MAQVSQLDVDYLRMGREHIRNFLYRTADRLNPSGGRLLEIGSQGRTEVSECFHQFVIDSLDLTDQHKPTYVGDITKSNACISAATYDCVACIDVLEHTLDPFAAIREMARILKPGGFLLLSCPLNFRIHGPLPDCWRFTEHGLKVLLREWEILELDILESPGRELFPIHYNVLARKSLDPSRPPAPPVFRFIE